jgi:hypothetical protein
MLLKKRRAWDGAVRVDTATFKSQTAKGKRGDVQHHGTSDKKASNEPRDLGYNTCLHGNIIRKLPAKLSSTNKKVSVFLLKNQRTGAWNTSCLGGLVSVGAGGGGKRV